MTKKTIGIPGWKTGENSFGCGANHLEFISKFGNPRIILNWENHSNVAEEIDLLYLPGGADLNPAVYGQAPGFHTSNTDVHKQYFYDNALAHYAEHGTPIFGVCLGFQMICAMYNIQLTQNLPFHPQSTVRWKDAHEVYITSWGQNIPNSSSMLRYLQNVLNVCSTPFKVNSHHHQGVLIDAFKEPKSLAPVFTSQDDVVECVIHNTLPIVGVQWHPEEFYDDFTTYVINLLLNYYDRREEDRVAPSETVMIDEDSI